MGLLGRFTRGAAQLKSALRESIEDCTASKPRPRSHLKRSSHPTQELATRFARYDLPHRIAAHEDFDIASAGAVKVLKDRSGQHYPDMRWEPKAAFTAIGEFYGRHCMSAVDSV